MRALPEPLPSSRSGSARRTASLVLSLLLACGALASCRGETPSAPVKGEAPHLVFSLHRLNLDGVGSIDDRAAVFIRGDASTTVEVRPGKSSPGPMTTRILPSPGRSSRLPI